MDAPWSRRAIWALLLITAVASARYRYVGSPGNDWKSAINSDGRDCYGYLRMFLFKSGTAGMPHRGAKVINQLGGSAAMMAPFVAIAHLRTLFNQGATEDGYSLHYQIAVGLAAWCWLAIGLFALRDLMLRLGNADARVAVTLLLLTLGTGLITQAVVHPAMTHVYGFAAVALFMGQARKAAEEPSTKRLAACAALLALAIWVRPVNGLVLFAVPVAALGIRADVLALRRMLPHTLLAVVIIGMLVFALQSALWWIQSGGFFARPYPGEGFHWTRPEVMKSWFNVRNGLFFYWPVLLLPFIGIACMLRRHRVAGSAMALFTIAFVYVTASWWNWAYGDNFGQRTYVDVLPVLAIATPFALPANRRGFMMLTVAGALACALNLFQSWQYSQHILVTGQMHMEQYARLFLSGDPERALENGGHDDMPLFAPRGYEDAVALTMLPATISADEQPVAWAPMPTSADAHVRLVFSISRTEFAPGGSDHAALTLALKRGHSFIRLHRFRLNRVPEGGNSRVWQHAYNLHERGTGDTLMIMADGLDHARVDALQGWLQVRR